jgi:hypothetical protein
MTTPPLTDDSWCLRCQSIDFRTLFSSSIVSKQEHQQFPVYELGALDPALEHSPCTLCRLLYAVRVPQRVLDPSDIDLCHPYQLTVVYSPAFLIQGEATRSLFIGVFPAGQITPRNWLAPTEHQYIVPVAGKDNWDYGEFQIGAWIDTASISYNQISSWISTCMDTHPKDCHTSVKRPPALQCIDCSSREIVLLPDGAQYITLSYVWGNPMAGGFISTDIQDNISNRGVSQSIPSVVHDAIQVVLGLNYQYLWVDAFCIDQNDPKTKSDQISRMDRIYEGALLTIIASAGSDATSRIHGVGHPRLQKQLRAQNKCLRLVSTLSNMSNKVSSTIWATRGWTYQESAVSRRCLYLTDTQAYFLCPSRSCSEALPHGSPDVGWDHMGSLSREVRFGHAAPGPDLRQLAQHLQEYSRRSLTCHSDNLNAFRGLLGRSGFPSYFGIPVAPVDCWTSIVSMRKSPIKVHIGMARGLYWTPVRSMGKWSPLLRIPEFPSWSWAGWKGSVQYAEERGPGEWARGGPLMSYDRSFPHIKVWVETAQGDLEKLDKKLLAATNKRFLSERSPYIHIEGQAVKLRLQPALFDSETLVICRCHFNAKHRGHIKDEDLLAPIFLCLSPSLDPAFAQRLMDETWTAVILFRSHWYGEVSHSMLILDTQGDAAQRVGAVTIRGPLPDGMVQSRQRFKIG